MEVVYEDGHHRWMNPALIAHEDTCHQPPCTTRSHDLGVRLYLAEMAAQINPDRFGGDNRRLFRVWHDPDGREWVLDTYLDLREDPVDPTGTSPTTGTPDPAGTTHSS